MTSPPRPPPLPRGTAGEWYIVTCPRASRPFDEPEQASPHPHPEGAQQNSGVDREDGPRLAQPAPAVGTSVSCVCGREGC